MSIEDIKAIAETGAIGISILLIGLLSYLLKLVMKIIGNHINHSTEALTKVGETNEALRLALDRNTDTLDKISRK